jgi:hypothetical protein
VPTSVETTSAGALDLTPEHISKPDLKQVGLLFLCPRLGRGSAVEHPQFIADSLADVLWQARDGGRAAIRFA